MKKAIMVLMLAGVFTGCQQKEEPKPQYKFPSGPVQAGPIQMSNETDMLKRAVKEDPKNVNAWIKLGNISMDSARFGEAIEAYGKALEIEPRNVDVRVDMGTCYRNIGRPDMAAKEYRKALSINPNHLYAHKNLGVVLAADLHDRAQAIKEFEKYLQLAPDAPDAEEVRREVQMMKTGR